MTPTPDATVPSNFDPDEVPGTPPPSAAAGRTSAPATFRGDDHFYNELTQINNELVNLKREIAQKNAQLAVAEASQRQRLTEMRVLFDLMPAMVWFKDTRNVILRINQRAADQAGRPVAQIEGRPSEEIYPQNAARFYADDLEVIRSGAPKLTFVETLPDPQGQPRWVQTDKVPYFDSDGKVIGIVVMAQDITERKRSEARLAEIQRELVETSRQAGMEEVATNVLHSVGNVLNSVNVSADLVAEKIRNSRASKMAQVAALLGEHSADLGNYLTVDPKGRHIPKFLQQITKDWIKQQEDAGRELALLRSNVDHIKQIVAMQQRYSKVSAHAELVEVRDLVEDSLLIKERALQEHQVEVVCQFVPVPPIRVERHKAVQILVCLLRNSRHACGQRAPADRRITLKVMQVADRVAISVGDNGIGIAPDNLTRIFAQGYSTRKDGHGLSLHRAALTAGGMGGSLGVSSEGLGHGATFTLTLPMEPPGGPA